MKIESLAYRAYTELRRKILSAQIAPDTRLKEDLWAEKLDVSRMAIRESLTRLLGEQLVTLGARGGFFVRSLGANDVVAVRQLREILELGAVRLACKRITREQISILEKICEDFTSMVQRGYYAGACEADLRFHETLMECSGNRKLCEIYINSHIPLFHKQLTKNNSSENDYEQTDVEHRSIVAALKRKDLAQAERVLKEHFLRGARMMDAEFVLDS